MVAKIGQILVQMLSHRGVRERLYGLLEFFVSDGLLTAAISVKDWYLENHLCLTAAISAKYYQTSPSWSFGDLLSA